MIEKKWYRFAPLPDDILARLAGLTDLFVAEGVLLVYLFGSLAQKLSAPETVAQDVDLALFMPADKRPFYLRQAITDSLQTERVDIVDLRRASPQFCFAVIGNGRCLYALSDEQRLQFELATVRTYHDTDWRRRRHELFLQQRMSQWLSKDL